VCGSVLQCAVVCGSVWQRKVAKEPVLLVPLVCCSVSHCGGVCGSVLQCVSLWGGKWQYVTLANAINEPFLLEALVGGSVWQCVAVCGSVWQCVALCGSV